MPAKKKAKKKKSSIPSNVKNKALYSRVKAEAKKSLMYILAPMLMHG